MMNINVRKLEKIISWYLLILGMAVPVVWLLILLESKSLPGDSVVQGGFHLLSEGVMAITALMSGWRLMQAGLPVKLPVFLALGMVLCSTFLAVFYYLFTDFQPVMFVVLMCFFILAGWFVFRGIQAFYIMGMSRGQGTGFNLAFLFFGVMFYYLLNLLGEHLATENIGNGFMDLLLLTAVGYITVLGLKKAQFSLNLDR